MKKQNRKYGWAPDVPDHRDFYLSLTRKKKLPTSVDLRDKDIQIFDQGELGSCTANAIAAAYAFDLKKQNEEVFTPSRLFIYYNERVIENTVKEDAGAMIRDGFKTINQIGVCNETIWPYQISKFKRKPSKRCYKQAESNKAVVYQRVNRTLYDFQSCLASEVPIVIGIAVYESFESNSVAKTGIVPMPSSHEQMLGGHAVTIVGYDNTKNWFIVRNSWGPKWGDKGYFYLPYDYITNSNLSDDFWCVKQVS